jgi:hypothetical protein
MKLRYSFISPMRGGITENGIAYSYSQTWEEIEAEVDRLIDPELAMIPREGDPKEYPWLQNGDEEAQFRAERGIIELELPMPPLYLLPENSLLRPEWYRRADILKQQRVAIHAARQAQLEAADKTEKDSASDK